MKGRCSTGCFDLYTLPARSAEGEGREQAGFLTAGLQAELFSLDAANGRSELQFSLRSQGHEHDVKEAQDRGLIHVKFPDQLVSPAGTTCDTSPPGVGSTDRSRGGLAECLLESPRTLQQHRASSTAVSPKVLPDCNTDLAGPEVATRHLEQSNEQCSAPMAGPYSQTVESPGCARENGGTVGAESVKSQQNQEPAEYRRAKFKIRAFDANRQNRKITPKRF